MSAPRRRLAAVLLAAAVAAASPFAGPVALAAGAEVKPAVVFDRPMIRKTARRAEHDCALTFDDGPGRHTGDLLDILSARGVKATFFVLGRQAQHFPQSIARMATDGHEIGNHSWDHPNFTKLDAKAQLAEIEDTQILLEVMGIKPAFFRPPYGMYDKDTVKAAQTAGLSVMLWSSDSVDWRFHDTDAIAEAILGKAEVAQGVYLFHDTQESTVKAMPDILDKLTAAGCHFVTLDAWLRNANDAAVPAVAAAPVVAPPPVAAAARPAKSAAKTAIAVK